MRILYLMHVDWRWVKQRPHYLAEALAPRSDLRVMFRPAVGRTRLPENASSVWRLPLVPLPASRGDNLASLDAAAQRVLLAGLALVWKPDLIWLTFPSLISYLPAAFRGTPILYDCMDLATAFPGRADYRKRVAVSEAALVRAANVVLASSEHLARRLRVSYAGVEPKLVRNAAPENLSTAVGAARQGRGDEPGSATYFDVAYVGTISEWMDWESLLGALTAEDRLRIYLFGPAATAIPQHERLIYGGVIAHDDLPRWLGRFQAFLMPFRRSPLIDGVDPVKLYEYLAYGRPVLAARYPEIERFDPYVYLYSGSGELMNLLRAAAYGDIAAKATPEAIARFLGDNTWAARGNQVWRILEEASLA